MCGRFSLGATATDLAAYFGLSNIPPWQPRYNIAPTQEVLVLLQASPEDRREARLVRWGLVPSWAKDVSVGNRMINARAETVATKPAFHHAFKERRCLVLADGFYEWEKQNGRKQPYHIRLQSGRPFAFAGLQEHWEGEAAAIESCAIITTTANIVVEHIHNRMPVIVPATEYAAWLDPSLHDVERLQSFLRPYTADEMVAHPVSTWVNNPVHDSPDCATPLRTHG